MVLQSPQSAATLKRLPQATFSVTPVPQCHLYHHARRHNGSITLTRAHTHTDASCPSDYKRMNVLKCNLAVNTDIIVNFFFFLKIKKKKIRICWKCKYTTHTTRCTCIFLMEINSLKTHSGVIRLPVSRAELIIQRTLNGLLSRTIMFDGELMRKFFNHCEAYKSLL